MFLQTIHIIEIIIWAIMLSSVAYVTFFAMADLVRRIRLHMRRKPSTADMDIADADMPLARFLVLFPTYSEDKVIVSSVTSFLNQ